MQKINRCCELLKEEFEQREREGPKEPNRPPNNPTAKTTKPQEGSTSGSNTTGQDNPSTSKTPKLIPSDNFTLEIQLNTLCRKPVFLNHHFFTIFFIKTTNSLQRNDKLTCLCQLTLGRSKIDLGTVNLAVQEKGIRRHNNGSQEEENSPASGGRSITRAGRTGSRRLGNRLGGLFQSWKNVVDVVASRVVSVVLSTNALFTLGSFFVSILTKFENFVLFLLVIIVVVVIVVVVVVFLDLLTRDAVAGNNGFLFVWKRSSVVQALVDSRLRCLCGATFIGKDSKINVKSVGASWSNKVLLVVVAVAVVTVLVFNFCQSKMTILDTVWYKSVFSQQMSKAFLPRHSKYS